DFSHAMSFSPLLVSLILAPLATELPEAANSLIWTRDSKDVIALGNVAGAMVFQSTIPVTIGVLLTLWDLGPASQGWPFAIVAAACGGGGTGGTAGTSPSPGKAIKVGLVTDVGGLNDKSFNQAANTGRLQAEKDLGLQTQVIESKKQEDYVPNLTTFAQQNY